MFELGHP
jgi:hypothetical protein